MREDTSRLSIAIVIDDFYPASGGVSRSVQTQISEFTKLGHNVTLIAPRHHLEKPDNCQTVVVPSLYFPGAPPYTCIITYSMRLAKKIGSMHHFDIVHSQTERGALMLAARIAKDQQIPHVHTFHANLAGTHETDPFASFWGSMAYMLLINPSIALASKKRFSDEVILPGPSSDATSFFARFDWHSLATIASRVDAYTTPALFMKKRIDECSPGLKHQGHIVPTGVSPLLSQAIAKTKRNRHDKTVRFLSVSRLSKEKRVDVIIKAFIEANIPNSQLDIVGSGDQRSQLGKLAAGHNSIIFHDHLGPVEDIAKLYVNADTFVLASYRFDTQAITIAEAAVAGLPIIYCDDRLDIGVNPTNSVLAKSPDAESIADCMIKLSSPKLRTTMSSASRDISKTLQPTAMIRGYIDLYRSLKQR